MVKAATVDIYSKGKQGGIFFSSKGTGRAEEVQSSEAMAAMSEVSDVFH